MTPSQSSVWPWLARPILIADDHQCRSPPGQSLVLTKPLGIGIISTALKRQAPELTEALVASAVSEMCRLNAVAAEVAVAAGATGGTDVTGFGLLGHLGRAAIESEVDVTIDTAAVPIHDGVAELAAAGYVPGGSQRNLAHVLDRLDAADDVDDDLTLLLADAQTSGGLVFGVDAGLVDGVVAELVARGHRAAAIGHTRPGSGRMVLR